MSRTVYRCVECGWMTPKWLGRCGGCRSWETLQAEEPGRQSRSHRAPPARPAVPIDAVDPSTARPLPTGVGEFDRVLGGGLVPGSVVLFAGEPGIGKSTLLLDAAARFTRRHGTALYVTAEESAGQVRARADRIGALAPRLYLAAETSLEAVEAQVAAVHPALLIVDSVQTVCADGVDGTPGGVSQVREVAAAMIRLAKSHQLTVVLIGHVTKDGLIAGPRLLEHAVDVVLYFEGDRTGGLRLLRPAKNRFGTCEDVGCFRLTAGGIEEIPDPSLLFVSGSPSAAPGVCATVAMEGTRPLVTEIQALVAPSAQAVPRRSTAGLDAARVAMTLAVVERRAGVVLAGRDVFVATVGGARIREPAGDLALVLAVASAAADRPLPPGLLAVGEVGLAGEIRPVPGWGRRITEAGRLGFRCVVAPVGVEVPPDGPQVITARDVREALRSVARLGIRSAVVDAALAG